jgi:hypothetical protein
MIVIDGSALQVVGGLLLLAALFVLREFASGALRQAGEDFWARMRPCRSSEQVRHPDDAEPVLPRQHLDAKPAYGQPEPFPDSDAAPDLKSLEEELDTDRACIQPPTPLRTQSNTPRKTA